MEDLTVRDLNFTYPLCTEKALERVSFSAERGAFITVCGATGSGKSTLLRLLKRELRPNGELSGEVLLSGTPVEDLDERMSASSVGYVMQRPEQQIVTDKVWHELAFGLENLGLPNDTIRRRVSEMACYFGIEDWFEKRVDELSGGQKQLLNLASVMVMQPKVLLLDEPTAQLDPIAAADFIATVSRLNRELSLTVLIVEHRLEDVLPVSDKILALRDGKVMEFGNTREVVGKLKADPEMLEGMPAAVRLYAGLGLSDDCPMTVREGRDYLETRFKNDIRALPDTEKEPGGAPALQFDEVFFRYRRELPDVLRAMSFKVFEQEIFCILGGNGSGKSTALSVAAALEKPYAGTVRVFGQNVKKYHNQTLYKNCLVMLPQDVQTVFLRNTVREELLGVDLSILPYDLTPLLDHHPYDLSGGQQQLVALARTLSQEPRLLLLDEPTKGLDAHTKAGLIRILKELRDRGMTIVIVTHDMEFSAEIADRCAMLFGGEIISQAPPRHFFADNSFYTTPMNRMTRGRYDRVSLVREGVELALKNGRRDDVRDP